MQKDQKNVNTLFQLWIFLNMSENVSCQQVVMIWGQNFGGVTWPGWSHLCRFPPLTAPFYCCSYHRKLNLTIFFKRLTQLKTIKQHGCCYMINRLSLCQHLLHSEIPFNLLLSNRRRKHVYGAGHLTPLCVLGRFSVWRFHFCLLRGCCWMLDFVGTTWSHPCLSWCIFSKPRHFFLAAMGRNSS